jgi:hypothetical protein
MSQPPTIVIKIDGRLSLAACLALTVLLAFAAMTDGPRAQKTQEKYKDKFNIADSQGGVAVATSSDGQYVYVAGPQGVIISEEFGKVGSWVQTVRLK